MKAVILAGGTGSRLMPLTKVTNKHLLPIGDRPMIFHSLEKIKETGIREVMIVTGVEHIGDIIKLIGSGSEFDLNITYRVQDKPDGIAGALALAKNFIGDSKFVVILGDNIFKDSINQYVEKFNTIEEGSCMLILKEVENPNRFGVATIVNNSIVKIVEKPKTPESNLCVTGIYFFDRFVFDKISNLNMSQRGELEISDINQMYVDLNKCYFDIFKNWWTDAGTINSYNAACQMYWGNDSDLI